MKLSHRTFALFCGLGLLTGQLSAEGEKLPVKGLSTGFGKVQVTNLRPGVVYRISKLYAPVTVLNTSDIDLNLKMELMLPKAGDLGPGYEAVPSLKWALLEKTTFFMPSFESASSDLVLQIPDEPSYWGKKFQLQIWSHTFGGQGMMAVGLMHKLLFTTAAPEMRGAAGGQEPSQSSNFSIEPFEVHMGTVPMKDVVSVAQWSNTKITLRNPHPVAHRFRLRTLRPDQWEAKPLKEYELCDGVDWLKFREDEVTAGPGAAVALEPELSVSPSLSLRGKKCLLVVRTEMLDGEAPTSIDFRVYFTVTPKFKREWMNAKQQGTEVK